MVFNKKRQLMPPFFKVELKTLGFLFSFSSRFKSVQPCIQLREAIFLFRSHLVNQIIENLFQIVRLTHVIANIVGITPLVLIGQRDNILDAFLVFIKFASDIAGCLRLLVGIGLLVEISLLGGIGTLGLLRFRFIHAPHSLGIGSNCNTANQQSHEGKDEELFHCMIPKCVSGATFVH